MPVGNDVVDLRDPETRKGAVHPRFDLRVFTAEERERIHEVERSPGVAGELAAMAADLAHDVADLAHDVAGLTARFRWSLWAAKESAFKAARKVDPGIPFHPRHFAVSVLETARAEVVHRSAGRFDVWLEEARGWVHAVARPSGSDAPRPRWAVDFLTDAPGDRHLTEGGTPDRTPSLPDLTPGERVRLLARRTLAPLLEVDPRDVRIVMEDGIPRLRTGSDPLPVDLSLSHHGRVVACAWSGS